MNTCLELPYKDSDQFRLCCAMLVPVLLLEATTWTPTDTEQDHVLQGMPVNCQQRFVDDMRRTGFGMQCHCCASSPGQC